MHSQRTDVRCAERTKDGRLKRGSDEFNAFGLPALAPGEEISPDLRRLALNLNAEDKSPGKALAAAMTNVFGRW